MIYEMEALATTLKQARKRKGLSQRQLSALSGVPQSHISKIEKAGVDLRISSLSAIANALDLELTLIPKKIVPAVKSISKTIAPSPIVTPEVANILGQIAKQVETVRNLKIDPSIIDGLARAYRELKMFENLIPNVEQLQKISEVMKTIKAGNASETVKRATERMAQIRNKIAHSAPKISEIEHFKPKYQLDGDSNE